MDETMYSTFFRDANRVVDSSDLESGSNRIACRCIVEIVATANSRRADVPVAVAVGTEITGIFTPLTDRPDDYARSLRQV